MARETRRSLLRWFAGAGSLGLAGCQGTDGGDGSPEAEDEPTEVGEATASRTPTDRAASTAEVDRTIDLDVSVTEGDGSQLIELTGRVSSPDGIAVITIDTTEDDLRIEPNGAPEHDVSASLSVDGGQTYAITVSVREPDGDEFAETFDTGYVPLFLGSVVQPDRLVGAHYYPWYEMHAGHENWTDRTVEEPVLGEYAADDPAVIDRHLAWCLEHGIRWLSVSWWGPGTGTDRALRDALLEADRFDDLEFSILYETMGRLGDFHYDLDDSLARDRLTDDLQYLQARYFGEDSYLHLDGRPVVFVYISDVLRGNLPAAFDAVFGELETEPYLLADVPFGTPASTYPITQVADAVTAYNPYSARPEIEELFHDRYESGNEVLHLGAEAVDVGYVPVAIPGYNDTEIPDEQREDNPVLTASPDRFARVCDQAAPHLQDAEAVLVTSFNEWYENTQIEPNTTYGTEYLELTRDRLATGTYPGYEASGTRFRVVFNETVVPADAEPDSTDTRPLAFMAAGLRFLDGGTELASYDIGTPSDEPLFLEGAFGTESNEKNTWRWFGGHTETTTMLIEADVADADQAVLTGQPIVSDEITGTVHFDGREVGRLDFGKRDGFDDYVIPLS